MSVVNFRDHAVATCCIGVLVFVATFGAYSGIDHQSSFPQINSSPKQQSEISINAADKRNNVDTTVTRPGFPTSEPLSLGSAGEVQKSNRNLDTDGTEYWPSLIGVRLKIADTLMITFTGLLFVATFRLWRSTEKLVAGADITAERQLRAYVSVKPTVIIDFATNHIASVIVIARNDGATPARKFGWSIFLQRKTEEVIFSDKNFTALSENRINTSNTLQPRADFEIFARSDAALTEHDRNEILAGTGNLLYVFGQIDYDDIFGQTRFTKFCAYVDSKVIEESVRAQSARDWNRMGTQLGQRHFPTAREETNVISGGGLWVFTIRHNDAT